MPTLYINAIKNITLQDPYPTEGLLVIKVDADNESNTYVTKGQLQRLRKQLASLTEDGSLRYEVVVDTNIDLRTEEYQAYLTPVIYYLNTKTIDVDGANSVSIFGDNLLAGQTSAAGVLGTATATNGHIHITSVQPGEPGNDITVTVVNDTSESYAEVNNDVTIHITTGTSTYASITTLINGATTPLLKAVRGGSGADKIVAQDKITLSGGGGSGLWVTVGGVECTLLTGHVTDSEVRVKVPSTKSSPLVSNDLAVLELYSNTHRTRISVQMAEAS